MEEELNALKDLQARYYAEFQQLVSNTMKKIQEEHQAILDEKEKLSQVYPKLQQQQLPSVIVLNIGGTKFSTALTTLRSQKNSFFDTMFSERWNPKPSEDGSFFIDRDPYVFRHILNFMREGTIDLEDLTPQEIKAISKDAVYYQLDTLSSLLSPQPPANMQAMTSNNNSTVSFNPSGTTPTITLSNNNRTATYFLGISAEMFRDRVAELNTAIPVSSQSTFRFKFKIEKLEAWIAIGLFDSARPDKSCTDRGHGIYAISDNSLAWNSDDAQINFQQLAFKFRTGDIVEMEYNAKSKILLFRSRGEQFNMNVNCPRDLIPVVMLCSKGDSVSLVD